MHRFHVRYGRVGKLGASDEKMIRAHYDALEKALAARNISGAMAGYAKDVLVFDISPPLQVVGHDNSLKTYEAAFAATEGPWEGKFSDLKIRIDHRLAVVTATLDEAFTMKGGEKVKMRVRLTDVFEKQNERWLVVHEHASIPVDMQSGKADFDAKPFGEGQPFTSSQTR